MGFFGFSFVRRMVDGKPQVTQQARWKAAVNIDEAHRKSADIIAVWREVSRWGDAAPFSGGVFDAWPRRIAQGIAFLRGESSAVNAFLLSKEG